MSKSRPVKYKTAVPVLVDEAPPRLFPYVSRLLVYFGFDFLPWSYEAEIIWPRSSDSMWSIWPKHSSHIRNCSATTCDVIAKK